MLRFRSIKKKIKIKQNKKKGNKREKKINISKHLKTRLQGV